MWGMSAGIPVVPLGERDVHGRGRADPGHVVP
jgi:hypothetical protein